MTETQEDKAPEPGRKPRKAVRHTFRVLWILLVLPFVFAGIALTMLIDHEVSAPSWIQDRLEQSTTEMLNGGSLEFGDIGLTLGRDLHLRARLENTVLRDADDTILARLPSIETLISPRGLLFRREVLVQEVVIRGAQLGLLRHSDGSVAISFQSEGGAVGEAASFVDLLEGVDRVLERPALEALEIVRAEGVIINYDDARANQSWTVDGGIVTLDLTGGVVSLRSDFSVLSGRPFVTNVQMFYNSPRGSIASSMGVTVTDAVAGEMASQFPALGWLSVVDAPINGSIRATVSESGALGPMFASLQIKEGVIQPTAESRPIPMRGAKTYLSYRPEDSRIQFRSVEADTDWGGFSAQGDAYLRDWSEDGWPQSFEAQLEATDVTFDPADLYPEPRQIDRVSTDFRLNLQPFRIDVGEFNVTTEGQTVVGSGVISADTKGWGVSFDAHSDEVALSAILPLWPESAKVDTRRWLGDNVTNLVARDLSLSLRNSADGDNRFALTHSFEGARFRPSDKYPDIEEATGFLSIYDKRFSVTLEEGFVTAPQGGRIDVAGSQMVIPDLGQRGAVAEFIFHTHSTLTAALAYLDLPHWQFLTKAGQPVTLADGQAETEVHLSLPLIPHPQPEDVRFDATATIRNVRSEQIVPDRRVTAAEISVSVDNSGIELSGPVHVGEVPMDVVWSRDFGPDVPDGSHLSADVELSQVFLSEFNIGLPSGMVRGSTAGQLELDLAPDHAPDFTLTSNLVGTTLSLPALGWQKSSGTSGQLTVSGRLGETPSIDRLVLDAAGLRGEGSISVSPNGGLDQATFDRVTVSDWFDGAVRLVGRGAGQTVGVNVDSGTLDLRHANFAQGAGEGGPMSVTLDRLTVASGVYLTNFIGEFDGSGPFHGTYRGALNGTAPVHGQVETLSNGISVRLLADNGGQIAMAAGLLSNARGEDFELTLSPTGSEGVYDGMLHIANLQVRDAPALAALLDAISVVGLLQQLGGQGLMFSDVDATFRLTPEKIIVAQSSAVGPGLGLSLDGTYTLGSGIMDFQGVISPLYLINGIGSILTRRGEGLIGFNFTLRGTRDAQQIGVNPLSALTPGMFREIFRRPPPDLNQ